MRATYRKHLPYTAPCVEVTNVDITLPMATSIVGDLNGLGSNTLQETGGDGIQLSREDFWADGCTEW